MENRVVELECRVALQEDIIETLGKQVHDQQITIDELRRTMVELREALQAMRPSMIATADEEAPPPHY
jgi:SlyX protein